MEKLDVVYLAPDVSSLFGAVSLAAGGLKTLVLSDDGAPKKGRDCDSIESLNQNEPFLWRGLRPGAFLEPLLNRLKLLISAREKVERIDPPLQVVTPDVRFDFYGADANLMKELLREFGGEEATRSYELIGSLAERAGKVYNLLNSESFPPMELGMAGKFFRREADCGPELDEIRRGTFSDAMRASGLSDTICLTLCGIVAAMGLPAGNDLPLSSAAVILDGVRKGIFRADRSALRQMLLSTYKKHGGYSMALQDIEGVDMDRNGIAALRLSKSNYLQSKIYVASESFVSSLLKNGKKPEERTGSKKHILQLTANIGAVPVGMRDRVVIIGRKADPLYPEHVTKISVTKIGGIENADNVQISVDSLRPSGIETIENELWEALRTLSYFVDNYVISSNYYVFASPIREIPRKAYYEIPQNGLAPNLFPREGDMLAEMGLGEGILSGRVLPKLILKKLGLRTDL